MKKSKNPTTALGHLSNMMVDQYLKEKQTETVLGMKLSELTLRDICEELTDLKRDLVAIRDFKNGLIGYSDFVYYTMCDVSDEQKIIEAIEILTAEKKNRQN